MPKKTRSSHECRCADDIVHLQNQLATNHREIQLSITRCAQLQMEVDNLKMRMATLEKALDYNAGT